MEPSKPTPLTRTEQLRGGAYALLLLWLNGYIARDFFSGHTAHMNSMQGFWTALAGNSPAAWLRPSWWPYWDCGIALEAAYSPLVPWLSSLWAGLLHVPPDMALSSIAGLAYVLAPLTLFAMAWGLTRAAGPSFFASLIYSLLSPSQWLVPDGDFRWARIWEARRLFLIAVWDDAPHLLALALLPVAVLFLARALEHRRRLDYALAALSIALMAAASAFGPVMAIISGISIAAASSPRAWKRCAIEIAATGIYAYLLVMAFVPPSVLQAIAESTAAGDEERWTLGSLTAFAAALLGFTLLRYALRRAHAGERVSFFAYFAFLAGSVPLAAAYLHRRLMPQPGRYKFELELGLALIVAFAGRALLARVPASIRRAAIFLLLALAAEQIVAYRKLEKSYLFPQEVEQTVEYRASNWAAANLAGARVFFPGSIAQWANAFSSVPQLTGGSFSMATNQSQQNAEAAILFETGDQDDHAQLSLTWLEAYGVSAIAVAAAGSAEYWKPFANPAKFDALPALWSESGVTIRRVPARSASLAHVVPESAIARHPPQNPKDAAEAGRYVAAMEDPAASEASLAWKGRERILIHATFAPGQVLSIQEGYSPGWRATVAGRHAAVYKDGLGLMWLRPGCMGGCEITLEYNGGLEWWLCHALSAAALIALLLWTFARRVSDRVP